MIDWIFILLVSISGLLFTAGDIFLKYWAGKSSPLYMAIAIVFYVIAGLFLAYSFKRRELAVAIAVLTCVNLLAIALVGFTLFKEVLGLKEIIGISFAFLAVILLTI